MKKILPAEGQKLFQFIPFEPVPFLVSSFGRSQLLNLGVTNP